MSVRADLIDGCAELALERLGIGLQPPIDLELLAGRLGVDEIQATDLLEDGRLERTDDATRILLRAANHRTRRRFTLAHELAHLLVARDPEGALVAHRRPMDRSVEERFCDALAASLIMPRAWVIADFATAPQVLATAMQMARMADVSLSAAVVRLRELCSWNSSLLRWARNGSQWKLVSIVGAPPRLKKAIGTDERTSTTLERTRIDCAGTVRTGTLTLQLAGVDTRIAGDLVVRSSSAAMLAALPRAWPR
jgi:Zn-dependent peptidase ImmA (M78 family)